MESSSIDHDLGRATAQHHGEALPELVLRHQVAVFLGHLHRVAERALGGGDDAHLVHLIGVGKHLRDQGVPAFVERDLPSHVLAQRRVALQAGHDPLDGVLEVGARHPLALTSRSQQRGLVDDVGQVRAGEAGRDPGEAIEVGILGQRHGPHVDSEDLAPPLLGRKRDLDLAVEASGPEQGLVEHLRSVRGAHDDDALVRLEAVHLGQQLVERLLALVVRADGADGGAGLPDGIDLVDEDDAGRLLLRLVEHVAHARGAHADEHLHELRSADREEREHRPPPPSPWRAASSPCREARRGARPSAASPRGG